MKKKITTVLFLAFLLMLVFPARVRAEECVEHRWGDWETTKEATALSAGVKSRYCSNCGACQNVSIPKLKAKISLKKKSLTIQTGAKYTLKIKSKTYGDKIKKWSSSNKKIATVSKKGKITGKKEGTAIITLTMKSGVKAKCKVKVTGDSSSDGDGSNSDNPPPSPVVYVWIPKTGTKYHSISTCSGMKSPSRVTLEEAINAGYEPCSKCY